MSYAFVDILYALAIKALMNSLILVEFESLSQALQLQFLKPFLDLAERQFNRVIFRRIGDIEDPLYLQHLELTHDGVSLVCFEVVHHNHYLFILVDGVEIVKESLEQTLINTFTMEFYVLKATSFADSCNYSRVLGAHRFARYVDICSALAPLVAQVSRLCKHDFINPYDLQLPRNGTTHTAPHLQLEGLIPTVSGFYWHLGRTDNLPLDKIDLVDGAKSPRFDELVWISAVEEDTPLFNTLSDPLLERFLRDQEVDMLLR